MDLRELSERRDLSQISALAERIWAEHYPGIISWGQIHYMLERSYSVEVIAAEIDAGIRWIAAWDDAAFIGFAAYGVQGGGRVKLDKLYVDGAWRGRGVATTLLAEVTAWCAANSQDRIVLTVNRSNLGAIRAYLKLGFAFEARTVADIGHGFVMDDYVMGWPVRPRA